MQSSADCPSQIMLLPVIVQLSGGLTVTMVLQTLEHPFTLVTVTEYVPAKFTVMQLVFAPVLHKYEAAPGGVQSSAD